MGLRFPSLWAGKARVAAGGSFPAPTWVLPHNSLLPPLPRRKQHGTSSDSHHQGPGRLPEVKPPREGFSYLCPPTGCYPSELSEPPQQLLSRGSGPAAQRCPGEWRLALRLWAPVMGTEVGGAGGGGLLEAWFPSEVVGRSERWKATRETAQKEGSFRLARGQRPGEVSPEAVAGREPGRGARRCRGRAEPPRASWGSLACWVSTPGRSSVTRRERVRAGSAPGPPWRTRGGSGLAGLPGGAPLR